MSTPSTIAGCGLCKHVKYMGQIGQSRCLHPMRAHTFLSVARMESGHCGPNMKSFQAFTAEVPAMHSIPQIGGQS